VTGKSSGERNLKSILLVKYKNDTTMDMEVIYKFRNGSQIGSSLVSLIDQILNARKEQTKSYDRDLFIFYSIQVKKIPLKLFKSYLPDVQQLVTKMQQSIQHEF
jgi:hypothetical protein